MHELGGGGAEKLLIDILKRLDYSRFEVTLLLIERRGVYVSEIPESVDVRYIFDGEQNLHHICNSMYIRNSVRKILLYKSLPKFKRYDTIVSFMEGESLRYHSLIAHRGKKNLSWVHIDLKANHWSQRYFWDYKEEEDAYLKMDKVIFVSEDAEKQFKILFPKVLSTGVIRNFVDGDEVRAKASLEVISKKDDAFTIVGVGRLVEQKRFDRFIDVIKELRHRGHKVTAIICGDGHLREELKKRATEVGGIQFTGFVKNPFPYVKSADLFLCTSDSEGFSLVVAEAMSLGKPIVSTKVTGPSELLFDDAGILTGFDIGSIANSIESLINDAALYARYSAAAFERSKQYSPDNAMNLIHDVLA